MHAAVRAAAAAGAGRLRAAAARVAAARARGSGPAPAAAFGFNVKAVNRVKKQKAKAALEEVLAAGVGSGASAASGGGQPPPPKVVANEAITAREVRVLLADKGQLGVMSIEAAREEAAKRGLDVIMVADRAEPPVVRLSTLREAAAEAKAKAAAAAAKTKALADEMAQFLNPRTRADRLALFARVAQADAGTLTSEQAAAARAAWAAVDVKEARLSARTLDHDLGTKVGRMVEHLRDGFPVEVAITITPAHFARDEPGARDVYGKVARRVAEAGVGWCAAKTLSQGPDRLQGRFDPAIKPRPTSDWAPLFARLAAPLATAVDDARLANIRATAAAAVSGDAGAMTAVADMLPSEDDLEASRSRKGRRAWEPTPASDRNVEGGTSGGASGGASGGRRMGR
jgi:translation initiation factor IF-3